MEAEFKIHLFSSESPREDEKERFVEFLRAGLDYLHLRHPSAVEMEMRDILDDIPPEYLNRIILHDYPSLAREYGCGFQLNGRYPDISDRTAILSRSCHSLPEVKETKNLDFVTLSPVYDSISKPGYSSAFPDGLSGEDKESLREVVALGGITLESIPALQRMGFGGAALLGAVWNRKEGPSDLLKYLRMRNLRLQFITDGRDPKETIAQARDALRGGIRWIQVRMKGETPDTVKGVLLTLRPEVERLYGTLIVDDLFELTPFCHGVHLGQNDAPVAEVRESIEPDKIIGLTVNNASQIRESLSALPDYYGVGPFRFTSTKKNLAPVLGLEGYGALTPLIPRPYVAIGGILPQDVCRLFEAGVSGIAVSGIITRAPEPEMAARELLETVGKFKSLTYL